jgi:hypothetical protein
MDLAPVAFVPVDPATPLYRSNLIVFDCIVGVRKPLFRTGS